MVSIPPATSRPATNESAKGSDAHSLVPSSGIGSVIATVPVGTRPVALVYNPADGEVYVSNSNSNNVSVISGTKVVANVPVGSSPGYEVYDGIDGDTYVSSSNNVSDIAGTSNIGAVPQGGGQMAFDPVNGYVYVTRFSSNDVNVIHGTTLVATILVGTNPGPIAYSPANGDMYVVNWGSNNVSVISGTSVVSTVRVGTEPYSIAYDAKDGDMYVGNAGSANVTVISGMTVVANVAVANYPYTLVYDGGNGDIYVACYGPVPYPQGYVSVVSGTAVVATVPVGSDPSAMAYDSGNGDVYVVNDNSGNVTAIAGLAGAGFITVGAGPVAIAVDPSSGYVYVANNNPGTVSVISTATPYSVNFTESGLPGGSTWSVSLNGAAHTSTTPNISFSMTNGTYPFAVGVSPGYSATPASGNVIVSGGSVTQGITFTYSVVSVPVGSGPVGLAYDSANGYVYVANGGSNNISVLSGTKVVATVPAYNSPWGVTYDSQNGYVYVANWEGGSGPGVVTVINGTRDVANISYSTVNGAASMGITYDSSNGTVWVANDAGNGIGVTVLKGIKLVWNITNPGYTSGIVYDPVHNYVYTSSRSSGAVSLMDASGTFDSLPGGLQPYWDIYDSYHHQVYVSEYGSNDLMIMNGTKVTGNITAAYSPMGVAVDTVSGLLFVTQYGLASVKVIDGTQSVETIPVGTNPIDAVYDPGNGYVYVTNRGSNNVSIINTGGKASTTLSGVTVSPSSSTLSPNGTQIFTASPSCIGGPCAPNVTYSWSLTNGLGTLSSPSGNPVTFTAGTKGGNLSLFVNATLNGTKKQAGPIPISISTTVPALASVSVSPPSASIPTSSTQAFSATPTCSGGPCPAGTSYAWTLNNSLGSVNPTTGATTTFTAGSTSGAVALTVTATLNGVSKQAVAPVTITSTNVLTSVTVAPSSPSVTVNGTQGFTATPTCTSTCPGSVAYVWTVNNSLGSVNPTAGSTTTFTAGPTTGSARLTVAATLNGVTKWANATVTITPVVPALSSVSISPTSITVGVGNSTSFTAHPNCTGGTCPSGATYSWSLQSSSLGSITPTSPGPTTTFTAGSTAGSEILYATASLNGVQQTGLAIINITKGTVPTITGLTLTHSPSVTVQAGKAMDFNTTATCNVSPCPTGIAYNWSLNNTLGNLFSTSSASTTFTAGPTAGFTFLTVTATLNGGSRQATSAITISSTPVPALSSVSISPGPVTQSVGKVQDFTVTATCSPGPCPASVSYVWKTNNTLGSLNATTGSTVGLTAGASAGFLSLTATASYNGNSVNASIVVTIISSPSPHQGNSTAPPTFLGLPGYDGYILLGVIVAAVAAAVGVALMRHRKEAKETPPPPGTYQDPRYPTYPPQGPYYPPPQG